MATEVSIPQRRIASINPATGEVLREFTCSTEAEVQNAVLAAQVAQKDWAAASVRERLAVLRRFQQELHAQKDDVAALISREAGKPEVEALLTEVLVTLDAAAFYRKQSPRFLKPQRICHANPVMKTKHSYLLREPYGVAGIIAPWNYPFSIPASEVLAAL